MFSSHFRKGNNLSNFLRSPSKISAIFEEGMFSWSSNCFPKLELGSVGEGGGAQNRRVVALESVSIPRKKKSFTVKCKLQFAYCKSRSSLLKHTNGHALLNLLKFTC